MAMDGALKIQIHVKETHIIDLPKPRNLTQLTQRIHQIPQDTSSSSTVLWTCLDLDPVIMKNTPGSLRYALKTENGVIQMHEELCFTSHNKKKRLESSKKMVTIFHYKRSAGETKRVGFRVYDYPSVN